MVRIQGTLKKNVINISDTSELETWVAVTGSLGWLQCDVFSL